MYALGDEIVDNIVSEEFIMRIEFENIVLRDMIESDIEDYVRWFTVEREWENWDAPWEKEDTDEESERRSWGSYYESVKQLPDDVLRWKLEIEWNGRHIGWVSSYHIGEDYKWVGEIEAGQIGISCIQTVVRGADANVARGDVQRGSLQSLIAVCDRDRRPVRAQRGSAGCSLGRGPARHGGGAPRSPAGCAAPSSG